MQKLTVPPTPPMPYVLVILLSFVLGLSGCSVFGSKNSLPQSPYFRQIAVAYDEHGEVVPGEWYLVNGPYLMHMYHDLEACYGATE